MNWDALCLVCSFASELSELPSSSSPAQPQKQTEQLLNVTEAQSAQCCSRWVQRDSKAYMKGNQETEKKGRLLLPFRVSCWCPPLLNVLRSSFSWAGTYSSPHRWPHCVLHQINLAGTGGAVSPASASILSQPETQFKGSPNLMEARSRSHSHGLQRAAWWFISWGGRGG